MRQDDVAEVSEEGIILVAEGVGVVGSRGLVEVEEDTPGVQLVGLALDLGL